MKFIHATAVLALIFGSWNVHADEPRRDFDFWIGEWDVQNRDLQEDGSWKDATRTRARITPVLEGNALLEEWAGPYGSGFMNGFSLRSWDAEAEHWTIVLFWTMDGNARFGRMNGSFRHGRGEFIAGNESGRRTRYTFSDALENTVRWDSATSQDFGVHWKTDWIMEFSRTRAASEIDADRLFAHPWNEGEVSPHEEARQLDWLLGEWRGTYESNGDEPQEARLRSCLLNKDCLVLELLEVRPKGSKGDVDWTEERLAVRGYSAPAQSWEAIALTREDPIIRSYRGEFDESKRTVTFTDSRAKDNPSHHTLVHADGDGLVLRLTDTDGQISSADLVRVDDSKSR